MGLVHGVWDMGHGVWGMGHRVRADGTWRAGTWRAWNMESDIQSEYPICNVTLRPGWLTSGSGAWIFCLRGALHCMTIKKYITVYLMHWRSYRPSLLTRPLPALPWPMSGRWWAWPAGYLGRGGDEGTEITWYHHVYSPGTWPLTWSPHPQPPMRWSPPAPTLVDQQVAGWSASGKQRAISK